MVNGAGSWGTIAQSIRRLWGIGHAGAGEPGYYGYFVSLLQRRIERVQGAARTIGQRLAATVRFYSRADVDPGDNSSQYPGADQQPTSGASVRNHSRMMRQQREFVLTYMFDKNEAALAVIQEKLLDAVD